MCTTVKKDCDFTISIKRTDDISFIYPDLERKVILAAAKTAGFQGIINIFDFSEKGSDRPTGQDMYWL